MNNIKKYLPSKKFVTTILVIVVLIALFLSIKGVISLFKNKNNTTGKGNIETVTVGNIIQKDSNSNGIADWEEYLWGLDPNKNGPENKQFIMSKKNVLEKTGGIILDDSKTISDNEMLSREFFAAIVALQQGDDLNEESIVSLSEAVGQKIGVEEMPNIYTKNDLVLVNDNPEADEAYLDSFNLLVEKYADKDIGSELTLISQGLGSNDPKALYAALTIAEAYREFGSELIKIATPASISQIHLSLANNYEKTGQSVDGLTKTLSDPLIGMTAVLNYKKYSDALVSDVDKLSEILQ